MKLYRYYSYVTEFRGIFVYIFTIVLTVLGWALLGVNGISFIFLFVLSVCIGYASFRYPEKSLIILFGVLPWIGIVGTLFFKYPVIPALIGPVTMYMCGYGLHLFVNKKKLYFPRIWKWIFIALGMFCVSLARSFSAYAPYGLNLNAPVAKIFHGPEINLIHAWGFILFNFLLWTVVLLFALVTYDYLRRFNQKYERLFSIAGISTCFAGIIAVYQYFFNPAFGNIEPFGALRRVSACFSNPNGMAFFLMMLIPVLIEIWIINSQSNRKEFIIKLFSICFLITILLFSGTRSAFAGTVMAIMVLIVLRIRQVLLIFKKHYFLIIGFILGVIVIVIFVKPVTSMRLKHSFSKMISKDQNILISAFEYRFPNWRVGWEIFKENRWFGTGIGRYLHVQPDFIRRVQKYGSGMHNENTCNYYLQVGVENGIVGFIPHAVILIVTLLQGVKILKARSPTSIAGSVLVFVIMLILFIVGPHTMSIEVGILFWFISAYIWALHDTSYATPRT